MLQPKLTISGSDFGASAAGPRLSRSLLLTDGEARYGERELTLLLDFFGIPWKVVSPAEIADECATAEGDAAAGFCVLGSAPCMAEALQGAASGDSVLPAWILKASSVYVYGLQDTALCSGLLRLLMGSDAVKVRKSAILETSVSVTNDFHQMCGPMSGISALVRLTEKDCHFESPGQDDRYQPIISSTEGSQFISFIRNGVRFFLNTCGETVDLSSPATKYFDVKESFCSSVPIAMYLKWAFSETCWTGSETQACLIIDDPLLRPRYGFLRYREILESMDSLNFTMTIAFIPWNWNRTNGRAVRLFQSRQDKLSLCVHGCDHTGSEFADRSIAVLNKRTKAASRRMESLLQTTSVPYDHVMVFPQGSFSPEAGRALKLNGFVAAVNTEIAPWGTARNETTVADLWDVAIMKYGTFPIFTRRYLTHGVENFAFDALLGKPCLMVAHHEVFKGGGQELLEFVRKLNSLKWNLRWCSVGDAISRSYKIRNRAGSMPAIRMYAEHLLVDNPSSEPQELMAIKEESDPDCVKAVTVNQKTVDHALENNYLRFLVALPPGQRTEVRVTYFDKLGPGPNGDGIGYGAKVLLRRHLSEIRDNYISQSDFLLAVMNKMKRFLN